MSFIVFRASSNDLLSVSGRNGGIIPYDVGVCTVLAGTVSVTMIESVSTRQKVSSSPRGRANLANYRVMRWLETEMKERDLSLREVGRRMGHANATRIREYLSQRIVPGPAVLGSLAAAIGVSPIEALWSAGRQDFVFEYLQALYELGWWWMRTDGAHLDQSAGALFFHHNPTQKRGREPVLIDPSDVPAPLRQRYHAVAVHNEAGIYRSASLPKPMACALLLAVGLFPRRGDRVRNTTQRFLQGLGRVAFAYIAATERRRVPAELKHLQRPLIAASDVLKQRFYGKLRLAIVGEYAHGWADIVCNGYADYARLALYDQGAFLGDATEYEDLWGWQTTSFPDADELGPK
jgi:hypothetical protein